MNLKVRQTYFIINLRVIFIASSFPVPFSLHLLQIFVLLCFSASHFNVLVRIAWRGCVAFSFIEQDAAMVTMAFVPQLTILRSRQVQVHLQVQAQVPQVTSLRCG